MAKKRLLSYELETAGKALGDAFTARVLAWQLGGTMVGALCFAVAHGLSKQTSRPVAFLLGSIGFIAAYVIVCAVGCIVARVIQSSAEDKGEEGVAPLHFLIDNIGSATLPPLIASAGAVLLAAVFCAPAALWYSGAWQAILVVPAVVVFVVAAVTVADLFVLLFIVPSMTVTEQPPLAYALRRIVRLFWLRKMEISKIFGVGIMVAVLVATPALLLVFTASTLCQWVYGLASGEPFTPFVAFILQLLTVVLIVAPILTVPLAFLNALSLGVYGELAEGLDVEEEEEAEEQGTAPSEGEDIDLKVQDEEPPEEQEGPTTEPRPTE